MKTSNALRQASPPHDYSPALQGALSWLGKRYLLAEPLNRRSEDRKFAISDSQQLPETPVG